MNGIKTILAISAHTDDVELGCGATLSRLTSTGNKVYSVVFITTNYYAGNEKLVAEWENSMNILCIPHENRFVYDYPARKLHEYRQEVLEHLWYFKRNINPDYVFAPSKYDAHQDHSTIGEEALRAFYDRNLWNYETHSWSDLSLSPQVFVPVTIDDLDIKVLALEQYKTQYKLKRPYFSEEYIRGQAAMRGIQIGGGYAEAFNVQRMIGEF